MLYDILEQNLVEEMMQRDWSIERLPNAVSVVDQSCGSKICSKCAQNTDLRRSWGGIPARIKQIKACFRKEFNGLIPEDVCVLASELVSQTTLTSTSWVLRVSA